MNETADSQSDPKERKASDKLVLKSPSFTAYVAARSISALGTGVTTVVLPVLVYKLTASPLATSALGFVEAIPYLVFGLFAGVAADRYDRRKIMVACDIACAIIVGSVPLVAALGHLVAAQLLVVALGVATAFVIFDAADFAALPSLVGKSQLARASSLLWTFGSTASFVAPAIGGVLLDYVGGATALTVDSISYVLSAALIIWLRFPPNRRVSNRAGNNDVRRESGVWPQIRRDVADGLIFVWRSKMIRSMVVAVAAAAVGAGAVGSLIVVYAARGLHVTSSSWQVGVLYSAYALGSLLSSLIFPRIAPRLSLAKIVISTLIIAGVIEAFLGAQSNFIVATILLILFQLVYTLLTMSGIIARQLTTPDELQGRVNTVGRLIAWGGQPVGALVGGAVAEVVSIGVTFAVMSLMFLAAVIVAARAGLGGIYLMDRIQASE